MLGRGVVGDITLASSLCVSLKGDVCEILTDRKFAAMTGCEMLVVVMAAAGLRGRKGMTGKDVKGGRGWRLRNQ